MPKLSGQTKSRIKNRNHADTAERSTARSAPTGTREPVWKGPEVDGITQSLLSRFLVCRERFRLLVVEGLRPADTFNHRLEYGQMWHTCEESLASSGNPIVNNPVASAPWVRELESYCRGLCKRYPTQQDQVLHWMNVCKVQFPLYVDWWAHHPDVKQRTPLLQEQVFDVPYQLPSGRTVRLRGKWDSVDLIGRGRGAGIYLQENKTKGDIDEQQLKRQLTFDLQTMIYLVALQQEFESTSALPGWMPGDIQQGVSILGVRYNVVRRPLSGGKGSIRKHQPTKSNPGGETDEQYYARLGGIIAEDPGYFFMRWKVEISRADVEKFKREFLNPILEQLCWWWDGITGRENDYPPPDHHWRTPYGFYNVLAEGGSTEVDEYLSTGSELGLQRIDELFGELK